MTISISLDDVSPVSEFELSIAMKLLIDAERALCLIKGASLEDRRVVEEAFWDTFNGPTARGVAVLVRFWSLVEVFSTQRFKSLLLSRGHAMIGPAVRVAAGLRFNAHWGLNPQRLLWGIEDIEARKRAEAGAERVVDFKPAAASGVMAYILDAA